MFQRQRLASTHTCNKASVAIYIVIPDENATLPLIYALLTCGYSPQVL